MKKIYISGKITGEQYIPCYHKFLDLENKIEELQFKAINPMKMCKPTWSWLRCIIVDLYFIIFHADTIILLPDWESSKGAKLEKRIAKRLKKTITDYDTFISEYNNSKINN